MAGLLSVGAAHAQTIIRTMPSGIVVASDLDGPYDDGPPLEAPPPRFAPAPYPPRAYGPPPAAYGYGPATAYLLPIHEIYRIVRDNGYSPLGAPQQRGAVYTIGVLDENGEDGRLVIDARNGRIIRFMPAYRMGRRGAEDFNVAYAPPMAMPRPVAEARASVPLPKPRVATKPLPETSAALHASRPPVIPPAPTAAVAAAPAQPVASPPVKPAVTPQPTQAMPPAQGVE